MMWHAPAHGTRESHDKVDHSRNLLHCCGWLAGFCGPYRAAADAFDAERTVRTWMRKDLEEHAQPRG
jgi:hypothetical protein